jgi:drug/metabolite transporter (DMT)-like permease
MKEATQGTIALLIACFFWGCAPTISKLGIESIPPLYFLGFSFLIGGISLGIIFIKKLRFINKPIILFSFFTSIILSAASILEIYGLKFISPTRSGLLSSFETISIPIICFFVFKTVLEPNDLISISFAFLGLILINHNGISFDINIGVIITIVSAALFAVQAIIVNSLVKKYVPILIAIIELFFSSMICLIFAFFTGNTLPVVSSISLFYIFFSGIFCSGVAFSLQALAQKYISAIRTGIINSTIPVFSILVARIIVGDSLSPIALFGSLIIIVSIINVNINGTKLFKRRVKQKSDILETGKNL